MIEEKTSKNIKIKWKIKLPPGIQKSDCTLAEYKISFRERGTILAPRLDAEVDIHYLSKSKQFYIQSLSGPSAEVYNFILSPDSVNIISLVVKTQGSRGGSVGLVKHPKLKH